MARVLQLTKYGSLAASTRQRFDSYLPYLQAEGMTVERAPLLDDDYLRNAYAGGRAHPQHLAASYAHRLGRLLDRRAYDLIWVHCEVFPYLPGLCERLVGLSGKPVVYDADDAIFHGYDLHPNPVVRRLLGDKLRPLLGRCDLALCGNAYLADYAARHGAPVQIVPTVVDTAILRPPPDAPQGGAPVIGWIGTPSTWAQYVRPMVPLLADVAQRHAARLHVIGAGPVTGGHPAVTHLDWSESDEARQIGAMDIGIMPLTDTPWARGKCGYKLIQYMACGLPVIASPVGVNADIVEHGVNGLLATTEAEWRAALATLLADPALRRRMGAAGRARVERDFSLQVWGPRVAVLLQGVARRGG